MEINQENFDIKYNDPVEHRQIRHFVCKEMERQIHRYIKAMHGSKSHLLRFEEHLKDFSLEQKEQAIARYFDLNRKAANGLDLKIILARAMANYTDTYFYLLQLLHDEAKFKRYLELIKETYCQRHEVIECEGKFGILDHHGRVLVSPQYDFLRTCYVYVDDLITIPIIAQKDGKMGLIAPDGHDTVVVPFIYDDISLRDEPPYFRARLGGCTYFLDSNGNCVSK